MRVNAVITDFLVAKQNRARERLAAKKAAEQHGEDADDASDLDDDAELPAELRREDDGAEALLLLQEYTSAVLSHMDADEKDPKAPA